MFLFTLIGKRDYTSTNFTADFSQNSKDSILLAATLEKTVLAWLSPSFVDFS